MPISKYSCRDAIASLKFVCFKFMLNMFLVDAERERSLWGFAIFGVSGDFVRIRLSSVELEGRRALVARGELTGFIRIFSF